MFSISDLAERAGVSVRTIRYYIAEGLLPAPRKRGRYAGYGSEYLDRLALISRLKAAFLPLAEIRKRLSTLSNREVSVLLASAATGDPVDLARSLAPSKTGVQIDDAEPPVWDRSRLYNDRNVSSDSPGAHWIRYRLEEGVELSVLMPLHPWRQRILQSVLAQLRIQMRDW